MVNPYLRIQTINLPKSKNTIIYNLYAYWQNKRIKLEPPYILPVGIHTISVGFAVFIKPPPPLMKGYTKIYTTSSGRVSGCSVAKKSGTRAGQVLE